MKLIDGMSLLAMVGVMVTLLHAGGVVSLSPQPLVDAVRGESPIVRAEIEQRERQRALAERPAESAAMETIAQRR